MLSETMHRLVLVVGILGCGQMYDRPGGQPQQQPPPAQGDPQQAGAPGDPAPGDPANLPPPPETADSRPSPPGPPAPPASTLGGDAKAWVDAHNRVRAKHCAPPLQWAPKLAEAAQRWANSLRDHGCGFEHSQNNPYGENLAGGTIGALDPASTVDYWYSEIKDYKFPSGGFSMGTGHFTQVVWANTTSVGCGRSQCNGNDIFVCEYDPPGNYDGEYAAQVRPVGCK